MMAALEIKEVLTGSGAVSFGQVYIMDAAQCPPCLLNRDTPDFSLVFEYRMGFVFEDIKWNGTFKILLLFYLIQ